MSANKIILIVIWEEETTKENSLVVRFIIWSFRKLMELLNLLKFLNVS